MNKGSRTIRVSDSFLQTEQVRQLSNSIITGAPAFLMAGVVTGWVLWNVLPQLHILLWGGLLLVSQLARVTLLFTLRQKPDLLPALHWRMLLRAGAMFGGLAWGMLPLFLLPPDLTTQIFLVLIMVGLIGGVQVGLVYDHVSVLLFSVAVLFPLGTRFLFEGGQTPTGLGIASFLYIGYLAASTRRSEQTFRDMLALHEKTDRLNDALNQAQEVAQLGSFDLQPVSGLLQWSDEHFRLWGLTPRSVMPDYALFLSGIHPDDVVQLEDTLQHALQGGRLYACVHRVVWPDGSVHHVRNTGEVMFNQAGQAVRVIGTVQDISEQIKSEQILIAARNEADRANAAKSEFLSSMSHELRTPMNAILGFSQLLQLDSTLSEQTQDYVKEILKAGDHLLLLINDVLDLTRVDSGKIDINFEAVEVCPLVEECLHMIQSLADKCTVRIEFNCATEFAVLADCTRLKQALLNLLSNAIKYNHAGGTVVLEMLPVGIDKLRILVTDTGSGIRADRLTELFQPFCRLGAENGVVEGTGIGLTITRKLIELMGGSVDVKSEFGLGSTFWIELPLIDPPAGVRSLGKNKAADKSSLANEYGTHKTVLYIEDNPANIKLIEQIFRQRNYINLITAPTPEFGIELAYSYCPDLILLDINLPGMNGFKVLEALKNAEKTKSIPVIAVTASALPRDIELGMTRGFSEYLTKPFEISRLNSLLDLHLN